MLLALFFYCLLKTCNVLLFEFCDKDKGHTKGREYWNFGKI